MDKLTSASTDTSCADTGSGLAQAVLREVARLLHLLALDPGFTDVIDLRSLPTQDSDRAILRQRLGEGEIEATCHLAGPTRISETAYAGVWWARHADADNRCVLEQIIVARVPELLLAHTADIEEAARRLTTELSGTQQEAIHG